MLLADEGTNWPYAYARMNDAVAHTPLSSEGHIGMMTGGLHSRVCQWSPVPIMGVEATTMWRLGGLP